ncbi:MAG: hypothetical protein N5P05_004437 (plasmid) [Chroococcopsis gigantea SAG 12.99]|jgi:hypothetical protein|nr:hypothetical protein [Chlorogloea purpurea SAG 13.99]MDV3002782.1 hypothetical protein [Chroococcopsis gigantea SAG 12.99]
MSKLPDENFKNVKTSEKIADLMEGLCSDEIKTELTAGRSLTDDQNKEWKKIRELRSLLAEEWRCRHVDKNHVYPIDNARDRSVISKDEANLLNEMIVEIEKRWERIQVVDPLLRQNYAPILGKAHDSFSQASLGVRFSWGKFPLLYPFKTDLDLFAQTLKEDVYDVFSPCLEPYIELPIEKSRDYLDSLVKLPSLNAARGEDEITDLKKILKISGLGVGEPYITDWRFLVIFTCLLPEFKTLIGDQLISYDNSYQKCLRLGIKLSKQRRSKSKRWLNGVLAYGTEKGGVYR